MKSSEHDEAPRNVTSHTRTRPHHVQRKTSHKGSSRDRHGRVFDDFGDRTIRAVTPDSMSHPPFGHSGTDPGPLNSPPLAQTSRSGRGQRRRENSASVSNTDEENTIERRRRRTQTKSRSSKDEFPPDGSPGSIMSKARKRLGSITTTAAMTPRADEPYGSIGFPSVVQSPELLDQTESRFMPKTPRRVFSPDEIGVANISSSSGFRSPTLTDVDSDKILHLMKTTCGRMHGILFFRPMHTTSWASGYCAINVAPGSLVCQVKGEVSQTKTLIPDLRGCSVRTHYDVETQNTYLSVLVASSGTGYQLRPPVPETFDSWLAALLCWQPLRPKGSHNKMTKPQPVDIMDKRSVSQRRVSDVNHPKSTAIVKVGKMLLWDGPLPSGSQVATFKQHVDDTEEHYLWRKVSGRLHENGNLRLLDDVDARLLSVTPLSQLARCAIQRLDESVLRMPNCIGIYPQYSVQTSLTRSTRPMILCLETNIAYEAWFVLLRALTVPELYGPEQLPPAAQDASGVAQSSNDRGPTAGMFRIERSLSVKITEAKFGHRFTAKEPYEHHKSKGKSTKADHAPEDIYAEVILGKDLSARTRTRSCSSSAFWAEEFHLKDLPPALSKITVAVKVGNPAEKEWTMVANGPYDISADAGYLSGVGGLEISSHDPIFGKIEVQIDELEHHGTIDKWWQLSDNNDNVVGQLLLRLSLQETVVLMDEEYQELSSALHNFSSSLTAQISQILGPELKQLSDVLLDLFQASHSVNDWISNLIEEEIDGIYRETPPRMRFSGRIQSNESYENAEQREIFVRDMSRSATMEANLLFRGNSLVTKAIDAHMRRLGKDYLEDVLGEKLRKIVEKDPDCEVDPNRVRSVEQLERNWANLKFLTNTIWKAISSSAKQCPAGLRLIFRHIRSCAEDRYGSFIRTVKYTSVSGFLFLRFFCPAILNPKLFGLVTDHPHDRVKRTFTLIAKCLNALANMAKFGTKEPWMERMNKFLSASTAEFKAFIEEICDITSTQALSASLEPQYAAPNQIRSRLPLASREGLPSLPYLLDSTKLMAELVDLWVAHVPPTLTSRFLDDSVRTFHELCLDLHQRSRECFKTAEQAERPNGKLESTWEQLLSEQRTSRLPDNPFEDQFVPMPQEAEITALPQTTSSRELDYKAVDQSPEVGEGDTTPSSSASAAWDKRIPFPHRSGEKGPLTNSTNSSTVSLELGEDSRARPLPGSRDGPPKTRLFDLVGSSSRRKGRGGDRGHGDDDGNEV